MHLTDLALTLLYIAIAIVTIGYLVLKKRYSYWADRGVPHEPPKFFYGNLYSVGRTKLFREPIRELYEKYKNEALFGGFYMSLRPAAVIFDLDLAKSILIKDFNNFSHRGNYYNEKDDPLSGHLFNLDGPRWRSMRAKLTPTFTSGKMKFMFPTVIEVAQRFVEVLSSQTKGEGEGDGEEIEVRELLARFTTDVIGTCAFGLECNSLNDPQATFRVMGKKTFQARRHGTIVNAFMQAFPNISRKLHLQTTYPDVNDFFMKTVRDTVEYREREHVQRNDFMNLLIELKNRNDLDGLTLNEVAAQAFVFFLAGFETSSSTMGFALYELAMNPDIQDRAREEINEVLGRHEGKFTYESVRELQYLKQIIQETLRRYSIASLLLRRALNDYAVPNTEHVIEKDVLVLIPVDAIHRDPEIYPNPDVFDPDRFEPQEIEKRHPLAWLPFGEGPRNCIGLRFGEMQSLIGLAHLLKNFRFSPSRETKFPMEYDLKSFILSSAGGIVLKVDKL